MAEFIAGDRVKFTDEWLEMASPWRRGKQASQVGTIICDQLRSKYARVKWDGNKGASIYHSSFIQLASPDGR